MLTLLGELLLLAFTLTAFGVMMAARIKQFQAFMALIQMLLMPLFFLSGALYPLHGLPAWLQRADPARPADLCGRPDAARGLQPPDRSARIAEHVLVAEHHLARLAGADPAVAGHRGRHGPRR